MKPKMGTVRWRAKARAAFSAFKLWSLQHPLWAFAALAPPFMLAALPLRQVVPQTYIGLIDSVSGGVLASLATYALVQYYFLQRESFGVAKWLEFGAAPTCIIPTYIGTRSPKYPGEEYYLVPPFDAQAAGVAADILRKARVHYPMRRIVGSHRLPREALGENIVTLCLPSRNQYTRLFLGLYHQILVERRTREEVVTDENVRAFLEDVDCKRNYFGMRHVPSFLDGVEVEEWQLKNLGAPDGHDWYYRSSVYHDGTLKVHRPGRPIFDYALIVKGPNPFNPAANILVACGIHGVGTLGAMLYLYEQASDLFARFPHRAQAHLVKVTYSIRNDAANYVDADIVSKLSLAYDALNEDLFWAKRAVHAVKARDEEVRQGDAVKTLR